MELSLETEPLGTAGPLRLAKPHLECDLMFVLNADTLCAFPFCQMIDLLCAQSLDDPNVEGMLLTTPVEDPSRFGVILSQDSYITQFVEKPKEWVGNDINAGL